MSLYARCLRWQIHIYGGTTISLSFAFFKFGGQDTEKKGSLLQKTEEKKKPAVCDLRLPQHLLLSFVCTIFCIYSYLRTNWWSVSAVQQQQTTTSSHVFYPLPYSLCFPRRPKLRLHKVQEVFYIYVWGDNPKNDTVRWKIIGNWNIEGMNSRVADLDFCRLPLFS